MIDRTRRRNERGDSLIELVVGMTIMVVFLSIFSGAIIMLVRTSSHAESVVTSSTDINSAFLRLDRSVRYAASISAPGISSSDYWYVEFLTANTGAPVCTQLRVVTDPTNQLQARTWIPTDSGFSNLSEWTPYASDVTNGTATSTSTDPPVPFTLITAGAAGVERLTVQLVTAVGNPAVSSNFSLTLSALNSQPALQAANNSPAYTSNVCNQVGRS